MTMAEELGEESSMDVLNATMGYDNSTTTIKPTEDSYSDLMLGAIIGAVVGFIVLLLVCIICCSCRRRNRGHRPMNPAGRNPRFNQDLRRRLRASRNYVAERVSRIINRTANTSTTSSDRAIIDKGAQRQESDIEQGVPSTDIDVAVAASPRGKSDPSYVNQDLVAKLKGESRPGYVKQALAAEKGQRLQNGSPGYINHPGGLEQPAPPPSHAPLQKDHSYVNTPKRGHQEDIDSAIHPPEHRPTDPKYVNLGNDGKPIGIESDYINTLAAHDNEDDSDYENNETKRQEALADELGESRNSGEHNYENCEFPEDGRVLYENGQLAVEQSHGTDYIPHTVPASTPTPQHPRPPVTGTTPIPGRI